MESQPHLVDTAIPAGAQRFADYAVHIRHALAFAPDSRREIPGETRARLRTLGTSGEQVLADLEQLSEFLGSTFVFDDLVHADREMLRDAMSVMDPAAHDWYQRHMLRINRLTDVGNVLTRLSEHCGGFLRRTMAVDVQKRLDDVTGSIKFRWKQAPVVMPQLTWEELNTGKQDMLRAQMAPLVQDVFDATVYIFNNKQPLPTLASGGLSICMVAIVDKVAAISRAHASRVGRDVAERV